MVVFLFVLAVFDLWVGVSNDAVNFLNSAIGSRVARFRTIVAVAAVGVFCGAVMSDGMMDVARHGILRPEQFFFGEVMLILLAVMVTDIVLLDGFNSLGMPTSTTVSLVFELLGATFAFAMLKMAAGGAAGFDDYMNTEKALQIILSIFLSVAVAFVFGALVQYLARLLFTFNYRSRMRWKAGFFGGGALTAIVYFMLLKGMAHLSFMTDGVQAFIDGRVGWVLGGCFLVFAGLMQLLHRLRVDVFRVVVLSGTFALATAFAGNDLVNFIGVPLAGYSAFTDYAASGAPSPWSYTMDALNGPASTPFVFLLAAGVVMVVSLATSKKAQHVVRTEVGLSGRDDGEEMFGSSRVARSLVRMADTAARFVAAHIPERVGRFVDSRFARPVETENDGAAYDLVRASVNLVVASLLIALGTSLKLPLSTTYVTFMVAMGSSLADRAWSRESAVFRVTGVLTVIGGWFITAGVAFTAAFFVALAMYYGGMAAVCVIVAAGIAALVHSQRRYTRKQAEEEQGDLLFKSMLTCKEREDIVPMLDRHVAVSAAEQLEKYAASLSNITEALFAENRRMLRRTVRTLSADKRELKNLRRRETVCLRRAEPEAAMRLSTAFHLVHNSLRQMLYGLLRIGEPAWEHVDNHFTPVSAAGAARFRTVRERVAEAFGTAARHLRDWNPDACGEVRRDCVGLREALAACRHEVMRQLQEPGANLAATTLLLHVVQETEQLVVELSALLKSVERLLKLS